jgi:hypothetical protein
METRHDREKRYNIKKSCLLCHVQIMVHTKFGTVNCVPNGSEVLLILFFRLLGSSLFTDREFTNPPQRLQAERIDPKREVRIADNRREKW